MSDLDIRNQYCVFLEIQVGTYETYRTLVSITKDVIDMTSTYRPLCPFRLILLHLRRRSSRRLSFVHQFTFKRSAVITRIFHRNDLPRSFEPGKLYRNQKSDFLQTKNHVSQYYAVRPAHINTETVQQIRAAYTHYVLALCMYYTTMFLPSIFYYTTVYGTKFLFHSHFLSPETDTDTIEACEDRKLMTSALDAASDFRRHSTVNAVLADVLKFAASARDEVHQVP